MDISKLFKWKMSYTIRGDNGKPLLDIEGNEITIYLRIIGDNDLDRAKKYALRQSRKLRADYRQDPQQILPDFYEYSNEQLASIIIINEATDIYKQAEREAEVKYPQNKESVSLEDAEEYEAQMSEYFDLLVDKIEEKAKAALEIRFQYYKNMATNVLIEKAQYTYINKVVEGDMAKIYNDAILFYSVYTDEECTKKSFKTIEEVRNSAQFLKEQLYKEYTKLVLKDTELKK